MGTEKDIFGKVLHYGMGKEDKPKHDLPKREDTSSLDYKYFTGKGKRPVAEYYAEALEAARKKYVKSDEAKRVYSNADAFARKHLGRSYADFLRGVEPEKFTENDYGNLNPKERRRHFERDTVTRLAALLDVEERGYDIKEIQDCLKKDVAGREITKVYNQRSEDYLVQLLDISEQLAREEETPFNLLKRLKELNEHFTPSSKKYAQQRLDLENRLKLREEEKF